MSGFEGPRRARPDEFAEAMRFTDMVFRPGQAGRRILQRQYPHAYRDEPAFARRLLLLKEDGELVGCVGVHPMTLKLGAARLRAGGIGIVGTHPERRGEGIMTTLLQAAMRQMHRAGYAVSVLGGDRQRYGHFGWENAGVKVMHHLTQRSLGAPTAAERRLSVRRLPPRADDALLARIRRLGASRAYGIVRAAADMAPLLQRHGKETWICQQGRRFAYAVAGGPDRQPQPYVAIHEFGGDTELTHALFRRLLSKASGDMLSVISGPNHQEQGVLVPVSATWFRLPDGMVQVLDVDQVIGQLQPELDQRANALGLTGRHLLQVGCADGTNQQREMRLGAASGRRRSILRLDQRELVELLFGPLPLAERFAGHAGVPASALASLSALLPLPLHVPSLSHI